MCPTDDLKGMLQSVADAERPPVDPTDDLARARAAARARARRRFRLGLTGATTAVVLTLGATLVLDRNPADPIDPDTATGGATGSATGSAAPDVDLVAEPFDATPYTFDLTPNGWSVQAQTEYAVTIAPDDGSASSKPADFRGKLVILFDGNAPDGRMLEHEGRRFWVGGDSSYTVLATKTRGDEPPGVVRIQYPDDAGWDLDSMVTFLASVHVGPGARRGLG